MSGPTTEHPAADAAARDAAPAVTIIVVSYNTRDMTLACLRSVFEQTTRTPFELVVVDNQSSDGSAEAIEAGFGDRLTLIGAETNLGFASGNNLAATHARGEFLLLLNPDTVVLDHAIDRLLDFAKANPGAGIWGGRTVFADGGLNPASCWGRMTLWSLVCTASGLSRVRPDSPLFNPEAYGGWRRDTVRQVDIVSGCFFLIGRELWQTLGGFDPAFFMYGEEADLCLRARTHGVRPMVTPEATIVHHGGASETVRADKLVRLLKAKATLLRRHAPPMARPLSLALFAAWPLTRGLAGRGPNAQAWRAAWRRRAEWLGS